MTRLANRSRDTAFLCYHSVADPGPPFLSVPPSLFEAQLRRLRDDGWAGGTLADLRRVAAGERPTRRTAFLTFDDGFADNHSAAVPLLREHGMAAFVFVLPPLLDEGGPLAWPDVADMHAAHPDVMRSMTWTQVEELAEAGHEIGSHTLSHPRLALLDPEALTQELLDSRRAIEARLGRCDSLAYPFGDWTPGVAESAARAGYEYAFTLPQGSQLRATPHSIPRVPVDQRDDERRFAAKLTRAGRTALLSPAHTLIRRLRRH